MWETGLISNILQRANKHKLAATHRQNHLLENSFNLHKHLFNEHYVKRTNKNVDPKTPFIPCSNTHSFSLKTHIWITLCVMTAEVLPQQMIMQEASFPRQMLAVGFITVIMCFLLLCFFFFFFYISPFSFLSNISPFSSHTFVFNITLACDQLKTKKENLYLIIHTIVLYN